MPPGDYNLLKLFVILTELPYFSENSLTDQIKPKNNHRCYNN